MKKEKSVLQDFSLGQQITIASVLKRMTKYSTPDEYGRSNISDFTVFKFKFVCF